MVEFTKPKIEKRKANNDGTLSGNDTVELYSPSATFDEGHSYLWDNDIDMPPAVIEQEEQLSELQQQVTSALAGIPNQISTLIEEIPWLLPRWVETDTQKKLRLPGHTSSRLPGHTLFMDVHDKPDDKKV
jgi:hypothetical protein